MVLWFLNKTSCLSLTVLCVACEEPGEKQAMTGHEDLPSKQALRLYLPTNEHMCASKL